MIPIVYNLRSLTVRKATAVATAFGLALVVFVFASAMMLANGVKKTLVRAGADDVAIVLRKGAESELQSNVDEPKTSIVRAAPQIARGQGGKPLSVQEIVVVILLDKNGTAGFSNVQVRGVEEDVWGFRTTAQISEGRRAKPGTDKSTSSVYSATRARPPNRRFGPTSRRFAPHSGVKGWCPACV